MAPLIPDNGPRLRLTAADVVSTLVLCLLTGLYGRAGWTVAAVSAALFGAGTLFGGYLYGYIRGLVSFPYIRVAYVVVAVFITLDAVLAVYTAAYGVMEPFLHDVFLYLAAAFAAWSAIVRDGGGREEPAGEEVVTEPETATAPESAEVRESGRIAVKKGTSIHIVETADILYISAMGDYVSIVTPAGRYVKEGTMAYYEGMLPDGFVRVHRSAIVNIAKISSVELYGKQNYNLRLNNGESVRASAAGYRTLKSRLGK
ncbi:MAG: LytTR family transcriptional regulator DNA-binding domain-containing protein [Alistipes sp.]|nr:LytTR family transcriptional regulator DNA-binding domain-containing protein [Alistipes sp.]